jgi:hypothetical protein
MNRLPDATAVLQLIDRFYDPLIARGIGRLVPSQGDILEADAA